MITLEDSLPELGEGAARPTDLVIYTDGGCWLERKIGGWGIHGYFFRNESAKVGSGCKKAIPTANGYTPGTGKMDITPTHYVDGFGSIPTDATNNIAELQAAINAAELILRSGVTRAMMLLDSKYVLQGITEWRSHWIANNWALRTGQPVANKAYWIILSDLIDLAKERGVTLEYRWVKGHQGENLELGNTLADRYASLAMRAVINGRSITEVKLTPAKGYWKTERSYSRLLSQTTWYYGVREDARDVSDDGRTIYYQGSLQAPVEFSGKPISDASLSIVYLKEPDPVLEAIRLESHKLAKASFYGLAVGYLPVIFKPENYELGEAYGTKLFMYDLTRNRLLNFKKEVLVEELRPIRRAYYLVERFNVLETILKAFLTNDLKAGFHFTDITHLLYEVVTGKKTTSVKLQSTITQATKLLKATVTCKPCGLPIQEAHLKLLVGQDMPDRNTLAALSDEGVKVVVATWADSASVIRFATIIQTTNDVGIWAGPYSNLHILPG